MSSSHDRLPRETTKAYAAFIAYLEQGPQRSVDQAALKVGKSPGTLRKWSERHGWVRRAGEYDELCARQEREIQSVLTRERAADWVKRQEKLKEDEWAAAEEAIALARELMGQLRERGVKVTLGDIAKLLDVASKLGRLATGLETDRRELTGEGGGPIKVEVDVGAMIKRVYGPPEDARAIDVESARTTGALIGVDGASGPTVNEATS